MKPSFPSAMGIAALFLVVGLGSGYWLALHRPHPQLAGNASRPPANDAVGKTERKVLYWHDPMVPGTRFDKPGKSPFMDMQLVPVYADDTTDQGKVSVS